MSMQGQLRMFSTVYISVCHFCEGTTSSWIVVQLKQIPSPTCRCVCCLCIARNSHRWFLFLTSWIHIDSPVKHGAFHEFLFLYTTVWDALQGNKSIPGSGRAVLWPHVPELIRAKQDDTGENAKMEHRPKRATDFSCIHRVKRSRKPVNKESVSVVLERKSMFFAGVLYTELSRQIQRNKIEHTCESNQLASASRRSMQMCDTTLTRDSTCRDFHVHQQYYAMCRS